MHLLVLDHLRRLWLRFLGVAGIVAAIWLSLLHGSLEPKHAFAGSMMLACMSGPMAVLLQFGVREIGILPVSRRDVWRARWLEITIIGAAVTATGKALTMAVAPFFWPGLSLRLDLLLLSTGVDVAALGTSAALMAWVARGRTAASSRLGNVLDILALVTILLFPFAGYALRYVLPVDVEELKRFWWVVAPGVVSFVVIQWHYPANLRPATLIAVKRAPRRATESSAQPPAQRRSPSFELARIVVLKALLPTVMGFVLVIIGIFTDSDRQSLTGWMFLACIVGSGDWRDRLRQLRLLPVSVSALIGMMLATSVLLWIGLIGIATTWHALWPTMVTSPPPLLWWLPLMGMSAIGEALTLRFRRSGRLVVIIAGSAAVSMVGRLGISGISATSSLVSVLGCVLLLAATFMIWHSLTRASTPYRAPKSGLTFGSEVPQTR